jgi:hypothetical protein
MEANQVKPLSDNRSEAGATLLEVAVATLMLTIGLLACALTMVAGIASMHLSQQRLIAKQKAREALESVFTARNTQHITYNQIRNVSDTTVFVPPVSGIFVDGWQPVKSPGTDGIVNTADDAAEAVETTILAGPDGIEGTADDITMPLTNYQRRITIAPVPLANGNPDPDIRQMTVEVRFRVQGRWNVVSFSSRVSRFS